MIKNIIKNIEMEPVCSVCIANYNGIGLIGPCLRSILEQDFDYPIEIIVHDDASTDGSVDFLKEYFSSTIKLIESPGNVGFCVSNNRMASIANGKYLLFLNNDAELLPGAVRAFYEHAEAQSRDAILGIRQYSAETGELVDFGIMFDPFLNSVPNLDLKQQNVGMVMGACLWIPRRLWDEIGGFPDWFHTMHEDMYLCCIARLYGYPVQVLKKSGYMHWIGKSLGGGKIVHDRITTSKSRRYLSERNRLYVVAMCYPEHWIYLIFPFHVFFLLAEGVFLSLHRKDTVLMKEIYLRAFIDAWKNRMRVLTLRRRIQKKISIKSTAFFSVIQPIPHKFSILIKYGIPSIT